MTRQELPPLELVLTPQEKTRAAVIALDLERIRRKRNALDAKRQRDADARALERALGGFNGDAA